MLSLPDFREKQIVFTFPRKGETFSFRNDNIIIRGADKKIIYQSSCYRLFALYIVGHVTLTTGLLQRSKKFGFSIVFMSMTLRVYGIWGSQTEGNFLLREKQYNYSSLDIASHLIRNKIENQIFLLKQIRQKDELTKETIDRLYGFQHSLENKSLDLYKILGLEGIASREYFKVLFQDCNWVVRRPRVKHDPINSLQDTGYTMLFNFIDGLLGLYGFDVYKGVYHQLFFQRKSLVCDLVEPFRPIIDSRIKKAHSLKEIKEDQFTMVNKQYRILGKKAQPCVNFLLRAILGHKETMFLYIQQYYRCFIREKPIEEYPVFLLSEQSNPITSIKRVS